MRFTSAVVGLVSLATTLAAAPPSYETPSGYSVSAAPSESTPAGYTAGSTSQGPVSSAPPSYGSSSVIAPIPSYPAGGNSSVPVIAPTGTGVIPTGTGSGGGYGNTGSPIASSTPGNGAGASKPILGGIFAIAGLVAAAL